MAWKIRDGIIQAAPDGEAARRHVRITFSKFECGQSDTSQPSWEAEWHIDVPQG